MIKCNAVELTGFCFLWERKLCYLTPRNTILYLGHGAHSNSSLAHREQNSGNKPGFVNVFRFLLTRAEICNGRLIKILLRDATMIKQFSICLLNFKWQQQLTSWIFPQNFQIVTAPTWIIKWPFIKSGDMIWKLSLWMNFGLLKKGFCSQHQLYLCVCP